MLGKFRKWFVSAPIWKASIVVVGLFIVCAFLAILWLALLLKSGWALVATVLGVIYWIACAVIKEGRETCRTLKAW